MNIVKVGLCLLFSSIFLAQPTYAGYAGCKSDCADDYKSDKEDCINFYGEPDEADDLKMCIEDAKTAYDECIAECDS
jgi:hypothetical protein